MISKRHLVFNIVLLVLPWMSLLFLGKRNMKRFSFAGIVIILIELINQVIGQKRRWWIFYDNTRSFAKEMLPFSLGPYMPLSMWLLKLSYGNVIKFLFLNAAANLIFAFPGIYILKKLKIANLYRLTGLQFFIYLFYKAFILYGVQYLTEKRI